MITSSDDTLKYQLLPLLHYSDVVALSMVCKRLNTVSRSEQFWKDTCLLYKQRCFASLWCAKRHCDGCGQHCVLNSPRTHNPVAIDMNNTKTKTSDVESVFIRIEDPQTTISSVMFPYTDNDLEGAVNVPNNTFWMCDVPNNHTLSYKNRVVMMHLVLNRNNIVFALNDVVQHKRFQSKYCMYILHAVTTIVFYTTYVAVLLMIVFSDSEDSYSDSDSDSDYHTQHIVPIISFAAIGISAVPWLIATYLIENTMKRSGTISSSQFDVSLHAKLSFTHFCLLHGWVHFLWSLSVYATLSVGHAIVVSRRTEMRESVRNTFCGVVFGWYAGLSLTSVEFGSDAIRVWSLMCFCVSWRYLLQMYDWQRKLFVVVFELSLAPIMFLIVLRLCGGLVTVRNYGGCALIFPLRVVVYIACTHHRSNVASNVFWGKRI
jgi:hypothetical protein